LLGQIRTLRLSPINSCMTRGTWKFRRILLRNSMGVKFSVQAVIGHCEDLEGCDTERNFT